MIYGCSIGSLLETRVLHNSMHVVFWNASNIWKVIPTVHLIDLQFTTSHTLRHATSIAGDKIMFKSLKTTGIWSRYRLGCTEEKGNSIQHKFWEPKQEFMSWRTEMIHCLLWLLFKLLLLKKKSCKVFGVYSQVVYLLQ